MSVKMQRILATGGCGQIGSELVMKLRGKYGSNNVVAADYKRNPSKILLNSGPVEFIDVTNRRTVEDAIRKYEINTIYHMAAILSAVGEKNPELCWNVNINGL
ncbi:GDP-mannose 4,6-dehydratase, partial [Dehalococcoidia bacterium]|nr:GDP-mannose 4,6-dehydratase [Dehalococcoidia bacterium]